MVRSPLKFIRSTGRGLIDHGGTFPGELVVTRPANRRGTSNANARGSATDRRARKLWLLEMYGDGQEADCALALSDRCLVVVTFETLSVDRIVPGRLGGTYRRENIRPACEPCQSFQGGQLGHVGRMGRVR